MLDTENAKVIRGVEEDVYFDDDDADFGNCFEVDVESLSPADKKIKEAVEKKINDLFSNSGASVSAKALMADKKFQFAVSYVMEEKLPELYAYCARKGYSEAETYREVKDRLDLVLKEVKKSGKKDKELEGALKLARDGVLSAYYEYSLKQRSYV